MSSSVGIAEIIPLLLGNAKLQNSCGEKDDLFHFSWINNWFAIHPHL